MQHDPAQPSCTASAWKLRPFQQSTQLSQLRVTLPHGWEHSTWHHVVGVGGKRNGHVHHLWIPVEAPLRKAAMEIYLGTDAVHSDARRHVWHPTGTGGLVAGVHA